MLCSSTKSTVGYHLNTLLTQAGKFLHLTINMIQLLPNFNLFLCFNGLLEAFFLQLKLVQANEIEEQWYMSTLNKPTTLFVYIC